MNTLKLTRRRFLSDIAGVGLAISLGNFSSSLFEQNTKSAPTMDLKSDIEKSRSFMIFSKQLEWITNHNELCELVAEIGFNGIELTVQPGGYVLPERVEEYDITGPISMHLPYQLMEGIDELDYGKRIKKTKEVMTQNGVKRLKTMLEQSELN